MIWDNIFFFFGKYYWFVCLLLASNNFSSTFQYVGQEESIYTAEIFWGGDINKEVDGIHPPVPGVEQHGQERLQTQELDHDQGDGEHNVTENQGHQKGVHSSWVDRWIRSFQVLAVNNLAHVQFWHFHYYWGDLC